MNLTELITTALIGATCTAFIGGVIALLRRLATISRMVEAMHDNGVARREEVKTIFFILSRIMSASKATLEALRDGKCNGGVTDALNNIDDAQLKYEELFMDSLRKRERVGEVA